MTSIFVKVHDAVLWNSVLARHRVSAQLLHATHLYMALIDFGCASRPNGIAFAFEGADPVRGDEVELLLPPAGEAK
jgi:hypothetical protein